MDRYINKGSKRIFRVLSAIAVIILLASFLLACVPHEQDFTPSDPSTGDADTRTTTTTSGTTIVGEPDPITDNSSSMGEPIPPDGVSKFTTNTKKSTLPETEEATTSTTSTIPPNKVVRPVGKVGTQAVSFRVFLDKQITVIYALDEAGQEIPIDSFYCSTGWGGRTPLYPEGSPRKFGSYWKPSWLTFTLVGKCYVRYPTHIYGDYFFHSVPYEYNYENPSRGPQYDECWVNDMKALGNYASTSGCIRLSVRDAAKLQSYNRPGLNLYVLSSSSGYNIPTPQGFTGVRSGSPYKISNKLGWDPTDWHQDNPYKGLTPPTTTTETTTTTPTTPTTTTTPSSATSKPSVKTDPTTAATTAATTAPTTAATTAPTEASTPTPTSTADSTANADSSGDSETNTD